ncbi:PREDICTED: protein RETICULATA-RELATED 6, chloroplastic-like [Ipomoea nil]|uniref:protein RETICULATA-RELATED 6, chloroplastic-like n=1 Tax=Ipomoea nil TaxID=35883 RepID=UPI00090153E1|nr:PREDICTED: protein RETICULATA-RELATED 6, chloroplastic-like [Ipomoea nil]
MECHVLRGFTFRSLHVNRRLVVGNRRRRKFPCHLSFSVRCGQIPAENGGAVRGTKRREVLVTSLIALGASVLRTAVARADDDPPESAPATATATEVLDPAPAQAEKAEEKKEEVINSRVYDATAIGEPLAVGKDKSKVWEKLMGARIVYLGEAEQVPTRDDKELELEIVKSLRKRCAEAERPISLALEAFPSDLQEQLNQFMAKSIDGETLKSFVTHWPSQRWQEYEPLLSYCNDNGVCLIACGLPLEVQRTVQALGIRGLSKSDRDKYSPPAGSGFISGFTPRSHRSFIDVNLPRTSALFGPRSYLSAQARVVEEYNMSQIILQAMEDDGSAGLLLVITGATHVTYGYRGSGLPARISRKVQKKNQVVVLLDPERQEIRREGEVPVADFLWYSAARPCSRNCYDRAEIARVMNAAGRRRDALPKDLQQGLDLGLVSPEVLQNFFDLEQYPVISDLTKGFQGFRERLLADPKFLNRLAIEEAISITTTLLAQYEKRKEKFLEEIDYVITDTVRGTVVDFFTVWLPAPTISFLPAASDANMPESIEALKGLLGSIPDNAFQKSIAGKDWGLSHRVASVIVGGLKLASVGFISSIGAVTSSNILFGMRKIINPTLANKTQQNKRSPVLKTALVYGGFLGTSANLRYQIIAGIIEHRISDQFSDQTLLVNMLSFVARTINSYWGTQQWIDLARFTGLQPRQPPRKTEPDSQLTPDSANRTAVECSPMDDTHTDERNETNNQ